MSSDGSSGTEGLDPPWAGTAPPRRSASWAQQARQLRAAGRSRREIRVELGIGDDLAKAFLRGVPLPDSLARPRAKDDVREAARVLRQAGRTYDQIAAELGVSKSTCSLWLRDLPHPEEDSSPLHVGPLQMSDGPQAEARRMREAGLTLHDIAAALGVSAKTVYYWTWDQPLPVGARAGGDPAHMEMMRRRYWDRVLAERESERRAIQAAHAESVGALSAREIELLAAATRWWAGPVDVGPETFSSPNLKRHNPKTVRKNVEQAYVGCLVVRLVQCRTLYQRIEGVWQGIMAGLPATGTDDLSRVV